MNDDDDDNDNDDDDDDDDDDSCFFRTLHQALHGQTAADSSGIENKIPGIFNNY